MTTTKTRPSKAATKPPAKKAPARKPAAAAKKATTPPEPAKPKATGSLTMTVARLKEIVAAIAPAASTDHGRPKFCAMRVELHADGSLECLAADSYRLHHLWLPAHDNSIKSADSVVAAGLIPAAWLQRQMRAPFSKGAEVTLSWSFDVRQVMLSFVDINGKSAATVSQPLDPNEWVDWRSLLANNPASAVADDFANLNPRLLAQMLAACSKWGDDAGVRLDKLKPCHFVANSADGTFTGLLMPVRVPQ